MTNMNRIHNSTNPAQGNTTRVLCVCSAGLLRSPTIANVLTKYGYNTRAVGAVPAYALIPVDNVLLHWADIIICSDTEALASLQAQWDIPPLRKVYNFHLPDQYPWMNEGLINHVEERIRFWDTFEIDDNTGV